MLLYLECWNDLESDRPVEWINLRRCVVRSSGAIPFTAIDTWARRKGIDNEVFWLLKTVITYLDRKRQEREASQRHLDAQGA